MVYLRFKVTLRDTATVDYDSVMKEDGSCCPVFMGRLGTHPLYLHSTYPEERNTDTGP